MVQEQFLKTEKTGLLLPALFEIDQLMDYPAGSTCSAKEAADIADAGPEYQDYFKTNPFILITGTKA